VANRVPRPGGSEESPSRRARRDNWSHDWYPYQNYLDVHYSHMNKLLAEQLVLRDRTSFDEVRGRGLEQVTLSGRLECARDLLISVRKLLEVRRGVHNRYEVRTVRYSYHGWIRGTEHNVTRYDNAHDYLPLHRHCFDLASGHETRVDLLDIEHWPTLDDVIREAVELANKIAELRGGR